jgi:uncharacterized protein YndB with AHSA1/START domain
MDGHTVSVERVIAAPASALFPIVADANRHPDFDGSGAVVKAKPGTPGTLGFGSTFGMSMKMGIGYSMVNTVVEFEKDRRIAWQARPPGLPGRFTAGRIWRYQLDPQDDGSTRVRESWDVSEDHQRWFLKLGGMPEKTRGNMEKTLVRIEEITAATQ